VYVSWCEQRLYKQQFITTVTTLNTAATWPIYSAAVSPGLNRPTTCERLFTLHVALFPHGDLPPLPHSAHTRETCDQTQWLHSKTVHSLVLATLRACCIDQAPNLTVFHLADLCLLATYSIGSVNGCVHHAIDSFPTASHSWWWDPSRRRLCSYNITLNDISVTLWLCACCRQQ